MSGSLTVICVLTFVLVVYIAYLVERDMQAAHPGNAAPGMLFCVITSIGVGISIAIGLLGGLLEALA